MAETAVTTRTGLRRDPAAGPLIVEEYDTTTVSVRAGARA